MFIKKQRMSEEKNVVLYIKNVLCKSSCHYVLASLLFSLHSLFLFFGSL